MIEAFSECVSDEGIPCGWYPTQSATQMFSIIGEEGNYFLRVNTKGGNTTIGKKYRYDLKRYPMLSWRWRAYVLPERAREDRLRLNDSGAAVYVIFRGQLWLNTMIKYVWSTTLEVGTETQSPHNSRTKVVVLRSGPEELGVWIDERVDVYRDYVRLFKTDPPPVEAIALMSDGDNTNSSAKADYDDFCVGERRADELSLRPEQ